jgi:hypothetical protein
LAFSTQRDLTASMALMSDLVLRVRQECDVVGSTHVTDPEILGWLNIGLSETYDLAVETYEDHYVNTEIFALQGLNAPSFQNYIQFPNDLTNPIWTSVGIASTNANQMFEPGPPAVTASTLHYMQQVVTQLQIDEHLSIQATFQIVVPGGRCWARLAFGQDAYVDVCFLPRVDDTTPQQAVLGTVAGGLATLVPVLVNGMDVGKYQVTLRLTDEWESTTGTLRIYMRSGQTLADQGDLNYVGVFETIYVYDVAVLQPINSWFFTLPDDFYKSLRIDRSVTGLSSDSNWYGLDRINIRDEALWATAAFATLGTMRPYGYLITDNLLKILPPTACAGTYRLLYYPMWPDLALTDRVDLGPPGCHWEEMAILYACAKVAIKEESDPIPFQNQRNEKIEAIRSAARDRDAGRNEPPPQTSTPWWEKQGRMGGFGGGMGGFGIWGLFMIFVSLLQEVSHAL